MMKDSSNQNTSVIDNDWYSLHKADKGSLKSQELAIVT